MQALHFNFKDLFRSTRIALSIQRIWTNGIGFWSGYLIYLALTYLSLLIGGYGLDFVWNRFGLLPCTFAVPVPWYSRALYIIALGIFLLIILLTNTAVARLVYMTLRNELFYSWVQAYKFAFKKWISILGAILTFIFIIAFFLAAAFVMGLLGRIPIVGEIGTALLIVPYLFATILLLFISLVFVVGIFVIPAILATSDEDALGGVFQSFGITFAQPWRLLIYGSMVGVLEIMGILVMAAILKYSYRFFIFIFSWGMGDKIMQLKRYTHYLINESVPPLYNWIHSLPFDLGNSIFLVQHHTSAAEPVSGGILISAYVLAFFLLMVAGTVIAYGEAIGNSGLTIIYIILYKIREKENLLEREDNELKEGEEESETAEKTEGDSETEEDKSDKLSEESRNESK